MEFPYVLATFQRRLLLRSRSCRSTFDASLLTTLLQSFSKSIFPGMLSRCSVSYFIFSLGNVFSLICDCKYCRLCFQFWKRFFDLPAFFYRIFLILLFFAGPVCNDMVL